MDLASVNSNAMQFAILSNSHTRNPSFDMNLMFYKGTGRIKANVLQSSILASTNILQYLNDTNSKKQVAFMGPPNFMDDGAINRYTFLWHPDYLAI